MLEEIEERARFNPKCGQSHAPAFRKSDRAPIYWLVGAVSYARPSQGKWPSRRSGKRGCRGAVQGDGPCALDQRSLMAELKRRRNGRVR